MYARECNVSPCWQNVRHHVNSWTLVDECALGSCCSVKSNSINNSITTKQPINQINELTQHPIFILDFFPDAGYQLSVHFFAVYTLNQQHFKLNANTQTQSERGKKEQKTTATCYYIYTNSISSWRVKWKIRKLNLGDRMQRNDCWSNTPIPKQSGDNFWVSLNSFHLTEASECIKSSQSTRAFNITAIAVVHGHFAIDFLYTRCVTSPIVDIQYLFIIFSSNIQNG